MHKKIQVFIFGYYGWGNTGDDAMLYALLQELPDSYPDAEFVVLSRIPAVIPTSVRGKIRLVEPAAIPAFWQIAKSRVFIIGGGTHIHDYGKCTKSIKELLRLFVIIAFAKLSGNKVYLLGNGIGPISKIWSKILVKFTCYMVDYITVRDRESYQTVKMLHLVDDSRVSLGFDLAALLTPYRKADGDSAEANADKNNLGICVSSVFEAYFGHKDKDLAIIDEIAKTLNHFLRKMPRLQIYLFVFKDGPSDSDFPIVELLREQLRPTERVKLIPYNPDPRETLTKVAQCSAFIGTKYHSSLFAYLSNIPLIVVTYHPKCHALADDIGLPKHAEISPDRVLNQQLGAQLEELLKYPDDFNATLPTSLARKRARQSIMAGVDTQR